MQIQVNRDGQLPVYVQIRNQLKKQILRGDLPVGMRLPAERVMARRLGVSRTTIVSAYDELVAEGLLESRVGRGTVVVGTISPFSEKDEVFQPIAWPAHFSALDRRLQGPTANELLVLRQLSTQAGTISFAMGLPDLKLLTLERFRHAMENALERTGLEVTGNSPIQGIGPLRELLAARMVRQDISAEPEGLMVVNGSQQGLDLLLRLLTEPGDTVIAEAPTYFGALLAFQAQGLRVIGIPVDSKGIEVGRAEFLLARYRPSLIYTVPTYQNPTGVAMELDRREKLLALAQKYQVPIIEDDPYSELYFGDPPPPSIKALDRHGHVLYLGTLSKCMAPGLRIGWLIAPQPVIQQAILLKRITDLQPNTLTQHLVFEFAQHGYLDDLIATARTTYMARCQAMETALRHHLPSGLSWHSPQGGIFLWLELPEQVSAYDLLMEAGKQGVAFIPGQLMYPANGPKNFCRLNFSVPDQEAIERGITILGTSLRRMLRRQTTTSEQLTPAGPIV